MTTILAVADAADAAAAAAAQLVAADQSPPTEQVKYVAILLARLKKKPKVTFEMARSTCEILSPTGSFARPAWQQLRASPEYQRPLIALNNQKESSSNK